MSDENRAAGSSGKGRQGTTKAATMKKACLDDVVISGRFDLSTWEYLGQGSAGVVVKLRDLLRDDYVAVKFMGVESSEEDPRRRLPGELKNPSWSSKYHTKVFGPGQSAMGEILFIEMEYVGHALKEEMRARREENRWFSLAEAIAISHDAACGVRDAHASGVIHRDIKPGNYLMPPNHDPWVKLADFGISKMRDMGLTGTSEFPGTPEYAAPEVSETEATKASDIWSLAETIFRIFTDQAPFDYPKTGGAAYAQLIAIIETKRTQTPKTAKSIRKDTPQAISDLLVRMLAKEPSLRPLADEVVDVLEGKPARKPIIVKTPTTAEAAVAAVQRPQPPWKVAAVAGVAVLVLVSALLLRTPTHRGNTTDDHEEHRMPPPANTAPPILPVSTTAAKAAPAATTAAAAAPSVAAAPARLRLKGDGLWFENLTAKTLRAGATLTVTDGKTKTHVLRLDDVEAGETLWLAPDDFAPPITPADGGPTAATLAMTGAAAVPLSIQNGS